MISAGMIRVRQGAVLLTGRFCNNRVQIRLSPDGNKQKNQFKIWLEEQLKARLDEQIQTRDPIEVDRA